MKTTLYTALLIGLIGCQKSEPTKRILEAHLKAVGDISRIENISTTADCQGSEGHFMTSTESSFTDDYLLFKQEYDYKNPFYAVIIDKKSGYGLDTTLHPQGPLSEAIIAVLKAHEFHEMMLQPDTRYFEMKPLEDTTFYDQKCVQLIASDHLGLPVRLYFDLQTKLMAGISQSNPYKKGEVISVHFENWREIKNLQLFTKVTVQQGLKSTFHFDFKSIQWNATEFIKVDIAHQSITKK